MLKSNENLQDITPYCTDEYFPKCTLKLDSNENIFGPSEYVLNACKNLDPKMFNYYPCYGQLLDKLSEVYKIDKENLLLTNGCDEGINIVLSTFLNKGENVVSYTPTFSMPALYAKIIGADFNTVKYPEKWCFSEDELYKIIDDKTKIVYLCTPNNPTGDVISPDTIDKIAKNLKEQLILVDLAYAGYANIKLEDYFKLICDNENLVCIKSFSKDFALAGLRLGFIAGNKDIIREFKKVISPYSVNTMAVFAGLKSLEDTSFFEKVKKEVVETREYLYDEFQKLGFKPYKSEANFVLVDFGEKCEFIYRKLLSKGIIVRKFSAENMKTCLRISIPRKEDAKKLVEILQVKDLLVFDLDGVVFDVSNSYRYAIEKTFEHYAGYPCTKEEMQEAKNLGGLSNDWDLTVYLLKKAGYTPEFPELVEVFTDIFYNPKKPGNWAIDNEKLVLDKKFFSKLSENYDLAVFTGRPKNEAFYSLEKFGIKGFFSYFVCLEDVPHGKSKPHKDGLEKIKKHCCYNNICYFGDTVDDAKSGKDACVKTIGIIPPNAPNPEQTKKSLLNFGAFDVFDDAKEILKHTF